MSSDSVTAPFRFIDLFAGVGGFHHALSAEGFAGECVLAVEIDSECRQVYGTAFKGAVQIDDALVRDQRDRRWYEEVGGLPVVTDIRLLTRVRSEADASELPLEVVDRLVPDHEVLCAGFPCQPFSKSGGQLGVRDRTRGTLFFDVMTIVLAKKPKYVLLENVRNLAGPRHRDTWATIVASLRDAGYRVSDEPAVVTPHLIPEELGGAPQVRDRVFVLARRIDGADPGELVGDILVERTSAEGWSPHDFWRIAEFLDDDSDIPNLADYVLRPDEVAWLEAWQAFCEVIPSDWLPGFPIWEAEFKTTPDILQGTPRWKADFLRKNSEFYAQHRRVIDSWRKRKWGPKALTLAEFPPSRRKFEWQARSWQPRRADRDLEGLVIHMRPSGIRVKPPTYLPALVAITQTSIVGPKARVGGKSFRRITPREAARLQGLPDDVFERAGVRDAAAYKQLGNAVNVGVVQYVAQALFEDGGDSWGTLRHEERKASA